MADFSGEIEIYNDKIYIDTKSGKGYDELIKKLEKFINYMAFKYDLEGQENDDMKQNIVVHILESLNKFDPNKGMKLSTFLQMRIYRQIINEIRDQGLSCNNPTILKTKLYSASCNCGNKFTIVLHDDDNISDCLCNNCNERVDSKKSFQINAPPISINSIRDCFDKSIANNVLCSDNDNIGIIANHPKKFADEVERKLDLQKFFNQQDPKMCEALNMICFDDRSIKDAAAKVGMSYSGLSNKIKKLKGSNKLREVLGLQWKMQKNAR